MGPWASLKATLLNSTGPPPATAISTAGASGEACTKRTWALPMAGLALLSTSTSGSMLANWPTAATV